MRARRRSAKGAAHDRYRASPVAAAPSHSWPIQEPPVQSPSGVVVHCPVSGSAQWGKPSFTRAAVSWMRPSMRSIAPLHASAVMGSLIFPIGRPMLPQAAGNDKSAARCYHLATSAPGGNPIALRRPPLAIVLVAVLVMALGETGGPALWALPPPTRRYGPAIAGLFGLAVCLAVRSRHAAPARADVAPRP